MARRRRTLPVLGALCALGLPLTGVATASPGGVAAPDPGSGQPGGVAYGTALGGVDRRPRATLLALTPTRVVAGAALPRVRLRIDQRGVARVLARVVLLPVAGHRAPIRLALGHVRTGTTVTAAWPAGARLAVGRYRVVVHATDPTGARLRRTAAAPGRGRLVVTAPPRPARAPTPAASAAAPDHTASTAAAVLVAPTPASTAGVFPVAGPHRYGDLFGAIRPGYRHQGVDVLAAEGTPVVAPVAGVVRFTDVQPAVAGAYVVERAADGRAFFFAHCQRHSFAVTPGQAVAAGTRLCRVGHTGDATGPHLHFELWPDGWRDVPGTAPADPLPQLRAWDR